MTEYERLETVANKYFNSLSNLALMIERPRQLFYTYKERSRIGMRILKELQEKLNINPNYIRFGEEPMIFKTNGKPPESNMDVETFIDNLNIDNLTIKQVQLIAKLYKDVRNKFKFEEIG